MKKLGLVVMSIIIVFFPIIMDKFIIGNDLSSNISNSEWVGFLGSYIGSIIGTTGTIGGVYLTIKLDKEKEAEDIVIYLNHILEKNLEQKKIITNEFLNNIIYKKKYFEYISEKIYEENFVKILKLKKREDILNIYSIQEEIKNIVDDNNIIGFLGHLKIKSFEELKNILDEEQLELIKLEEILEAISVLIDTTDETEKKQKKQENYFKITRGYSDEKIKEYLKEYKTPIERLKNFRKELLNDGIIMLEWDKIEINKKIICSSLMEKTLKSLKEIEEMAIKMEEYYLSLDKYFK